MRDAGKAQARGNAKLGRGFTAQIELQQRASWHRSWEFLGFYWELGGGSSNPFYAFDRQGGNGASSDSLLLLMARLAVSEVRNDRTTGNGNGNGKGKGKTQSRVALGIKRLKCNLIYFLRDGGKRLAGQRTNERYDYI